MKKESIYIISITLMCLSFQSITQTAWQPYELGANFPTAWLENNLLSKTELRPFPLKTDRSYWENIDPNIQQYWIQRGEAALQQSWNILPATLFLEYVKIGNRSNYEAVVVKRRANLAALLMAEIFENKGRFTNHLLDGLWATLEETYWGFPAHINNIGLPDVNNSIIDLFSAQTGSLICWIHYFLKEDFEQINPLINQRIEYEINQKLLQPYFSQSDAWWMGFRADRSVLNNWNPWINSNILTCALFFADDVHRAPVVHKVLRSLDQFLMPYPDDGGCDEGPGYWGHAAGSLFDCLEHLYTATQGKINYYKHPLVRNMATYVYKASITPDFRINFADASPQASFSGGLIYRFGKRISDENMMNFGAYYYQNPHTSNSKSKTYDVFRFLGDVVIHMEIMSNTARMVLLKDVWLPNLQVMTARSYANDTKGYYLAAKGGHNNESHNHNDVGQFIFFKDGKPILVDAGVGRYSARTFSKDRYKIWTMVSAYHNLPTIGDYTQQAGKQYSARAVKYGVNVAQAKFELDIAAAYPKDAGIQSWQRNMTLDREKGFYLNENFVFEKAIPHIQLNLITPCHVDVSQKGIIQFLDHNTNKVLATGTYDAKFFIPSVENIPMNEPEDDKVKESWQHGLRRIVLTHQLKSTSGTYSLHFY